MRDIISDDILIWEGCHILHGVHILLSQIEDGAERTVLFQHA
jgi:hypothetical protein